MRSNTLNQTKPVDKSALKNQSSVMIRILRRLGINLLKFISVLLILLSSIPIILMLFITAVPIWITGLLIVLDAIIIVVLITTARTLLSVGTAMFSLVLVSLFAVMLSQQFASTPPIVDEGGNVIPGSIASLERIELNGSSQWVTIRGHSDDLPVLLFLAGGPGGSELAMTRRYLSDLEEHFIVVNWDQPGTGKSYTAVDFNNLTPERYVEDAYALTRYLQERFDENKIYVFGESWGSILGIWLVQQHPDLFHAFVSTGQMVDVVENDIQMYEFAMDQLILQGRSDDIERLRDIGAPPYEAEVLLGSFNAMNGVVNDYMNSHAHGEGTGHNLMFDSLLAQEYGLLDKVNWLLGLAQTFTTVYPQLYEVDFRTQAAELEIPVYFIKGRWDNNSSNALLEEYFEILDAPRKELIWFEDSAHTPSWDEPAHFTEVMVNTVLAQTDPQR